MTVSAIVPQVTYQGNGATTTFAYTFEVTAASKLNVTLVTIATLAEQTLVLDVDYSVDLGTGIVTYPLSGPAMANTSALRILRAEDYDQEASFSTQGNFSPTTVEDTFDYAVLLIQQVLNYVRNGSAFIGPRLKVYTVGTLPSALEGAPLMIYVRDASGGGIPCFSDGTNWRRVDNREIVA